MLVDIPGHILLVGEGDFSFSASLASLGEAGKIVATCFEEKNPDVDCRHRNIEAIRQKGRCAQTRVSRAL